MEFKRHKTANEQCACSAAQEQFSLTNILLCCCEGNILSSGKLQSLLQDMLTHLLHFLPVMAGKEKTSAEGNALWWRRDDGQSVKGWGY